MKKMISVILAAVLALTLVPSVFAESEIPYQVENGGFETGDFTGWTLPEGWPTDENGTPLGLSSDTTYWAEEMPFNQAGTYHLDGWATTIPEPDITLSATQRAIGGLGMHLVRQIMDSVTYAREDQLNVLTLVKERTR